MSKRLKFASALSLALTAATALAVSDGSLAWAADSTPEKITTVDPAKVASPADLGIIFAPPKEVVQPLPTTSKSNTPEPSEAAANGTARSLSDLVAQQDTDSALDGEMHCLAAAVYFESKGESLAGQLAVARVVIARTESGRFPTSICGVVHQPRQFSFVRGGRMPAINTAHRHWRNAVAIARIAKDKAWQSPVEGALFFHARHVSPGWRLTRVATIDNHIFYR